MEKMLITGGAGYVGVSLIEHFIGKYEVVILDNLSKGRIENVSHLLDKVTLETADIRDSHKVDDIIRKHNPQIVIHLAAIVDAFSTNRKGKDEECMHVNYNSAVETARIAKNNGVRDFIFQSSVSMYSQGEDIDEEGEANPLSTYGRAKMYAEKDILELGDSGFRVCVLRPATLIGWNSGFRYETIINMSCIRSVHNIPLFYFESALTNPKSYLWLKDNARSIQFALDNMDKMHGQSYNISSFNVALDKVIEVVKKYLGRDFNHTIVRENSINQQVYTVSSQKIKDLGFKFEGDIENILQHAIYHLNGGRSDIAENFTFKELELPGIIEITPKVMNDERGRFSETFHQGIFSKLGIGPLLVQNNESVSKKGVLRGLHMQSNPHAQGKLIEFTKGRALDIIVDARKNSENYGKWMSIELDGSDNKQIWIPAGFLHGFLALEEDTTLRYRCSEYFDFDSQVGVKWNDPDLGIEWNVENPIVSEKDKNLPFFKDF